jgi:hypothetical protein
VGLLLERRLVAAGLVIVPDIYRCHMDQSWFHAYLYSQVVAENAEREDGNREEVARTVRRAEHLGERVLAVLFMSSAFMQKKSKTRSVRF